MKTGKSTDPSNSGKVRGGKLKMPRRLKGRGGFTFAPETESGGEDGTECGS